MRRICGSLSVLALAWAAPALAQETVTILASDCLTPQTTFTLGDTVCARVTNLPVPAIKLQWIDSTFSFVLDETPITTEGQTDTFVLPTVPPHALPGTWRARTAFVSDSGGRITATYEVLAPVVVVEVPTLSEWGLLMCAAALALAALWQMPRRRGRSLR